jgi:L-lysine exporter family protein LysE/ArgO
MNLVGDPSNAAAALSTGVAGFLLSLSLIAAIGAQNLFVLRQGLLHQYVGLCVAFCAAADAMLVALGVFGMAELVGASPRFGQAMALGGALFLLAYGVSALRRAVRADSSAQVDAVRSLAWPVVLAQLAALTLLNPHVYLDTVVLIGSIGARQSGDLKWVYVAGASCASLFWFTSLGYGARWLKPLFARPAAWRVLDLATGVVMLSLSAGLMLGLRGSS